MNIPFIHIELAKAIAIVVLVWGMYCFGWYMGAGKFEKKNKKEVE